ncbi:hypothetical protein R50073_50860 (plasmid) [Maricurvus nonylphenolicus]|uniref:IS66 family insertion sequence element accessory protein TnpA n=1 Tax=Maricurvus nonylphenolicus TaxID=1008307 RepID=UPI0036F294C8
MNSSHELTPKQRYWHEHLLQAKDFEGSLARYAKHHDLDVKALYHYQTILRQKGVIESVSKFTRVTQSMTIESMPSSSRYYRLAFANGHHLELPVESVELPALIDRVSTL